MSANIFWPNPELYVSRDPVCPTRCFISGLPQELSQRPVLNGSVTAFSQFPVENSWVNQLLGAETGGFLRRGSCVPPNLTYRCAINKLCTHNSLLTGQLSSGQVGGGLQTQGFKVGNFPDSRVLNYPQVNACTKPVYYRQTLDQRRTF